MRYDCVEKFCQYASKSRDPNCDDMDLFDTLLHPGEVTTYFWTPQFAVERMASVNSMAMLRDGFVAMMNRRSGRFDLKGTFKIKIGTHVA